MQWGLPMAGQCGCEDGYTEVMTSDGVLDQCTVIPVLEIPTAGDSKTDVKTIRAPLDPTLSAGHAPGRAGRTWFLQPFGQDGKLKTWVYGVAAGVFVLLVFIVSMTYLAWIFGSQLVSYQLLLFPAHYYHPPILHSCPLCTFTSPAVGACVLCVRVKASE
ncbi:unnamed protein product [Gadus morhua 'NCC']